MRPLAAAVTDRPRRHGGTEKAIHKTNLLMPSFNVGRLKFKSKPAHSFVISDVGKHLRGEDRVIPFNALNASTTTVFSITKSGGSRCCPGRATETRRHGENNSQDESLDAVFQCRTIEVKE